MTKVILLLIFVVGVMLIGAPAQSQQVQCPPGQSGNPPYCQAPLPACLKLPAFDKARPENQPDAE